MINKFFAIENRYHIINSSKRNDIPISFKADEFVKSNRVNKEVIEKMNNLISQMENCIKILMPKSNFKYPNEYKLYNNSQTLKLSGWSFPKGANFITEQIEYLKNEHGISDLVPFAIDKEGTCFACFAVDGIKNNEVQVIYPFAENTKDVLQEKYDNITDWIENGI